jgi:hypothetical protein
VALVGLEIVSRFLGYETHVKPSAATSRTSEAEMPEQDVMKTTRRIDQKTRNISSLAHPLLADMDLPQANNHPTSPTGFGQQEMQWRTSQFDRSGKPGNRCLSACDQQGID